MKRKKRQAPDPFLFRSDQEGSTKVGLRGSRVWIGFGANHQRNVRMAEMPPELVGLKTKTVVPVLSYPMEDEVPYRAVVPETIEGERAHTEVEFWGDRVKEFVSGSAVNMGMVLSQLARDSENRALFPVGVVAAAGTGNRGQMFARSLGLSGLEYGLVEAEETNFTVAAQAIGEGGGTLERMLCKKAPWKASSALVEHLSATEPDVVVFASIRPDPEFPLVEELVSRFHKRRTFIGFIPHPDLLRDEALRPRLLKLLKKVDLLQVNDEEAAILLRSPGPFDPQMMVQALALQGSRFTVITLAERGSVAAMRHRSGVTTYRQAPYPAPKKGGSGVGCGDTFFITLLYYLCLYRSNHGGGKKGVSFQRALDMASWVAGQKAGHQGPSEGIPSPKRCEDHLERRRK